MNKIQDNLYIGNETELVQDIVDSSLFDSVVTLAPSENQYTTHHHPLTDGENSQEDFDETVETVLSLLDEGDSVLVHCAVGISRSASIVSTVMAVLHDQPFDEALTEVKSKHPPANPHPELRKSSKEYLGDDNIPFSSGN